MQTSNYLNSAGKSKYNFDYGLGEQIHASGQFQQGNQQINKQNNQQNNDSNNNLSMKNFIRKSEKPLQLLSNDSSFVVEENKFTMTQHGTEMLISRVDHREKKEMYFMSNVAVRDNTT